MNSFLRTRLAPFRHNNFRYFFLAQSLSMVGAFSHDLARSWLVIQLMGKAGALGSLQMAIAIPSLFFILEGGVLVDRLDVRRILMWTKGILGLTAVLIACLVQTHSIQYWQLLVFGIIEGFTIALDAPAFQALTVRLVPREDFQQAIALNSTNFHVSRMLGPLFAGLLMAWQGPAIVFIFDALTYFLLVYVLSRTHTRTVKRHIFAQSDRQALVDGLRYVFSHSHIRYLILQLMFTTSLMFPLLITVFRTYFQNRFGLTAENFGYIFTFPAVGSVAGALIFAVVKPRQPTRILQFAIPVAITTITFVPLAGDLSVATALMSIAGFALYLTMASVTIAMQLMVSEDFRGRLSSLIGLCFFGLGPINSGPIGLFMDAVGAAKTIYISVAVFAVISACLAWLHRRVRFTPLSNE